MNRWGEPVKGWRRWKSKGDHPGEGSLAFKLGSVLSLVSPGPSVMLPQNFLYRSGPLTRPHTGSDTKVLREYPWPCPLTDRVTSSHSGLSFLMGTDL